MNSMKNNGRCPKCGTGFILEDREEDNAAMTQIKIMGRVVFCLNCGLRIFEKIVGIRPGYAFHKPRHTNLRL